MNIKKIDSKLIVLVRIDEIPILELLHAQGNSKFRDNFNFSGVETTKSGDLRPTIQFVLGKLSTDEKQIKIIAVKIEERRIIISVEGSSNEADVVWKQIREYFEKIAKTEEATFLEPQLIARESVIIANLDVSITDLVNPKYLEFVNEEVIAIAKSEVADAWSQLESLTFGISYEPYDRHLDEVHLTLNRKEFSISPRAGYPLLESIFISTGPFDTDSHVKLLEKFEKSVNKK